EGVPCALELAPQLTVVVDLAVMDDVERSVLVRDRLVAGLEVDDGETPRGQGRGAVGELAGAVPAPMDERGAHRGEALGIDGAARGHDSAEPAHAQECRDRVGSTRALHDARPAAPAGAPRRARGAADRRAEAADPLPDLPRPRRSRPG